MPLLLPPCFLCEDICCYALDELFCTDYVELLRAFNNSLMFYLCLSGVLVVIKLLILALLYVVATLLLAIRDCLDFALFSELMNLLNSF